MSKPVDAHSNFTCAIALNRGILCHITRLFIVVIGACSTGVLVLGICQFHLPLWSAYVGGGALAASSIVLALSFIKIKNKTESAISSKENNADKDEAFWEEACKAEGIDYPINKNWEKAYEEGHDLPQSLNKGQSVKQIILKQNLGKLYVGETYLAYISNNSKTGDREIVIYNHLLEKEHSRFPCEGEILSLTIDDIREDPLLLVESKSKNIIFEIKTGESKDCLEPIFPIEEDVLSYDSDRFVKIEGEMFKKLVIYSKASKQKLKTFQPDAQKNCVAADLRGSTLVCGFADGTIALYDLRTSVQISKSSIRPQKFAPKQVRLRGHKLIAEYKDVLSVINLTP